VPGPVGAGVVLMIEVVVFTAGLVDEAAAVVVGEVMAGVEEAEVEGVVVPLWQPAMVRIQSKRTTNGMKNFFMITWLL
jgi:hypothetical protein